MWRRRQTNRAFAGLPGSGRYRGIFSNSGRRTKGLSRGMSRMHNENAGYAAESIRGPDSLSIASISNVFSLVVVSVALASDSRAGRPCH
jgi:hypothetical protein